MDTKNHDRIPECGDLTILRKYRTVVGAKQLRKALEKGTAVYVCLAKNADPAITAPLAELCEAKHIPYGWVSGMEELGKACAIDVGAAAAAAVE